MLAAGSRIVARGDRGRTRVTALGNRTRAFADFFQQPRPESGDRGPVGKRIRANEIVSVLGPKSQSKRRDEPSGRKVVCCKRGHAERHAKPLHRGIEGKARVAESRAASHVDVSGFLNAGRKINSLLQCSMAVNLLPLLIGPEGARAQLEIHMHALHQAKPIVVSRTGEVHGGARKSVAGALAKLRDCLIALGKAPAEAAEGPRTNARRRASRSGRWGTRDCPARLPGCFAGKRWPMPASRNMQAEREQDTRPRHGRVSCKASELQHGSISDSRRPRAPSRGKRSTTSRCR
jgi:hypothetical protein